MTTIRKHRKLLHLLPLSSLALALACDADPDELRLAEDEQSEEQTRSWLPGEMFFRYDEVYTKSIHNAYETDESLLDQLSYHKLRSVEFDIVPTISTDDQVVISINPLKTVPRCEFEGLDCDAKADDWFVYHEKPIVNDSSYTTCFRLSDCLEEMRTFHLMNPYHAPITLFIDLKRDVFESGTTRSPDDFDARITTHLDAQWLYTPGDLIAACFGDPAGGTLRSALMTEGCEWPTMWDMRGKFVVVLTGDESRMQTYTNDGADVPTRKAFVSKKSYSGDRDDYAFFNLAHDKLSQAAEADQDGFVTRMYYYKWDLLQPWPEVHGLNSTSTWEAAIAANVNFLATDKVNAHKDPIFSSTSGAHSYPSTCQPSAVAAGCTTDNAQELDTSFTLDASIEGTIGGSSDQFALLSNWFASTDEAIIWDAHVGTANAHISDDAAAGCLMARRSRDADSPYFAVCRRGEDGAVFASWRTSYGAEALVEEAGVVLGVNGPSGIQPYDDAQDAISHLRLIYYPQDRCASAYASRNGEDWTTVSTICMSVPLPYQGVALSTLGAAENSFAAPGDGRIAARFSNVVRAVYDDAWAYSETNYISPEQFGNKHTFGDVSFFECHERDDSTDLCAGHIGL